MKANLLLIDDSEAQSSQITQTLERLGYSVRRASSGTEGLRLAREAMKKGGALPCALNAADEIAVAAFLDRRLAFNGIAEVIEAVLARMPKTRFENMADVLASDAEARRMAKEEVSRLSVTAVAS